MLGLGFAMLCYELARLLTSCYSSILVTRCLHVSSCYFRKYLLLQGIAFIFVRLLEDSRCFHKSLHNLRAVGGLMTLPKVGCQRARRTNLTAEDWVGEVGVAEAGLLDYIEKHLYSFIPVCSAGHTYMTPTGFRQLRTAGKQRY